MIGLKKDLFVKPMLLLVLVGGFLVGGRLSQSAYDPLLAGEYGSLDDWLLSCPREPRHARLILPPDDSTEMRVEIFRPTEHPWSVQLARRGESLIAGCRYRFCFEAKADAPRDVIAVVNQGQTPFNNLGVYQTVHLTTDWHSFSLPFTALASDANGATSFNLGPDAISVNVRRPRLEADSSVPLPAPTPPAGERAPERSPSGPG